MTTPVSSVFIPLPLLFPPDCRNLKERVHFGQTINNSAVEYFSFFY